VDGGGREDGGAALLTVERGVRDVGGETVGGEETGVGGGGVAKAGTSVEID
jgi:hypothetical protein